MQLDDMVVLERESAGNPLRCGYKAECLPVALTSRGAGGLAASRNYSAPCRVRLVATGNVSMMVLYCRKAVLGGESHEVGLGESLIL